MVSDVNNSSLQLVEMCSSEGVWSPVCDNNWTLQDATVVCRELEKQGLTYLKACMDHCYFYADDREHLGDLGIEIGSSLYISLVGMKILQFGSYLPKQDGTHILMHKTAPSSL